MYRRAGHPLSPLLRSAEPPERERRGAGERAATFKGIRRERVNRRKSPRSLIVCIFEMFL
jgi:hypothetical protein